MAQCGVVKYDRREQWRLHEAKRQAELTLRRLLVHYAIASHLEGIIVIESNTL